MLVYDIVFGLVIGICVLWVVCTQIKNIRLQQPSFNYQKKRNQGLAENNVQHGPSGVEIEQIVELLAASGQKYTVQDIDKLAFDQEGTWVMYANPGRKSDQVQGVMVAEKIDSRMHIKAYAVDQALGADTKDSVTQRLVGGIAWEGVQSKAASRPTFDKSLNSAKTNLQELFARYLTRYRGTEVGPAPKR